jgi:hypothetical protein
MSGAYDSAEKQPVDGRHDVENTKTGQVSSGSSVLTADEALLGKRHYLLALVEDD